MPDQFPKTQATLIYLQTPAPDFDDLLDGLNAALKAGRLEAVAPSGLSSEQFALMNNDAMHASVAVHSGPLGLRGLARALDAPASRAKSADFRGLLDACRAHLVVTVGSGPNPAEPGATPPVPLPVRLAVLQSLIQLVHAQTPCTAAHLGSSDLFCLPADIDGWKPPLAAELLVHPGQAGAMTAMGGSTGTGLTAHQSHHLLGRTLVFEGIPANVPLDIMQSLTETMIRQHLKGALPLADGDRLDSALGMSLYIRHENGGEDGSAGRLTASFWPEPPAAGAIGELPAFTPHAGYGGTATAVPDEAADEWSQPGTGAASRAAARTSGGPPLWIILAAIGLFLWIGLPMLNIPQTAIQSAFSNDLNGRPAKP